MTADQRTALIRERLAALRPTAIELEDQSAAHAGHASAGGGGHYRLAIVAAAFADKGPVERHKMVYAALGELMQGEIHALGIVARTPEEAAARPAS